MSPADFFHILNPNRQHKKLVARFFRDKSMDRYSWVERASHPTHLETIVEWAINEGHRQIAVWGGDGTLSRVVQALFSMGALNQANVMLMPVGTCNDFAKKLGLGLWRQGLDGLNAGSMAQKTYDVGLLQTGNEKRIFVNNAGFGRFPNALKKHRPNPIRDIFNFHENRLQIEWGTSTEHQFETCRAYLGLIFNAPYFNKGMHFSQEIEPDDGVLTAYFVPPQNRVRLLLKLLRSKWGRALADFSMLKIEANYLTIESDQELYPQVDGEPLSLHGVRTFNVSLMPRALTLLTPVKIA